MSPLDVNRRTFLKQGGLAVAGLAAGSRLLAAAETVGQAEDRGSGLPPGPPVVIIVDPDDRIAATPQVRWAVGELRAALEERGAAVSIVSLPEEVPSGVRCVVVAGADRAVAGDILWSRGHVIPKVAAAETLILAEGRTGRHSASLASGHDARGLTHATLELADRVRLAESIESALSVPALVTERPANVIRSVARAFVSEGEDKPWFYDRGGWQRYLTMLATHRYSRISLMLGIGYDSVRGVTDAYFLFPYPFLVTVPHLEVLARGVSDEERSRNLEMLRFISEEAVQRGLQFQLGLWTHAYEWAGHPGAPGTIQGLTPANHAAYCRDALTILLRECPAISGLTLRVHGESGIPEGHYDFWRTLFVAIAGCNRRLEIDLHAKGTTEEMIEIALGTGMPVNLSPKYCGEHMGLPYHQAGIRELEMPREPYVEPKEGVGAGARSFSRYGYADLLAEDRKFGVLFRIWPGTQRFLLAGDPVMSAGVGRNAGFCGSLGVEIFDPLAFKGRKGSGLPGGRCAYADPALKPADDWEKYLYFYRVWGRSIFNPDADPEGWRREARRIYRFSPRTAEAASAALASASRILPLITTAHGASGSNAAYWPEIYTNMPIADPDLPHPYKDTPSPKLFGGVSPFDPQLFSSVDGFVEDLLHGRPAVKYSPLEVAQWLEDLAVSAQMPGIDDRIMAEGAVAHRRWSGDVAIQSGLGRFFAEKFRSAVLWSIFAKTGPNSTALAAALEKYRAARRAWAEMAEQARSVYVPDITYGDAPHQRGHWIDRLPAIDADLLFMEKSGERAWDGPGEPIPPEQIARAIQAVAARPRRPAAACEHEPAANFQPGKALEISLSVYTRPLEGARLLYRRVNQAERWQARDMVPRDGGFESGIPAAYTVTRFPLQYYFEVDAGPAGPALYPGLDSDLSNQPYFTVRHTGRNS